MNAMFFLQKDAIIIKVRIRQKTDAKKQKGKFEMSSDMHVRAVEENLQELLGAKVRIRQGKTKGRIEIEFYDRGDLERVVESMVSMRI